MSLNITKYLNEIDLTPDLIEFIKDFTHQVRLDYFGTIHVYDAKIVISEETYCFSIDFHMELFEEQQTYSRFYNRSITTNPKILYETKFKENFEKHLIIENYKILAKIIEEKKTKNKTTKI